MGYIGASIYCNIGASNALSKEGDFRDSRRDLGQLIVIRVIVIWVIPNVFFAGANARTSPSSFLAHHLASISAAVRIRGRTGAMHRR